MCIRDSRSGGGFGLLAGRFGLARQASLFDEDGLQAGLLGFRGLQLGQLIGLAALDLAGVGRLLGDERVDGLLGRRRSSLRRIRRG